MSRCGVVCTGYAFYGMLRLMPGTLFMVATPIGNLEDVTLRAQRIFQEVDAVACEDTRVAGKLLNALSIKKPLVAIHEHSETSRLMQVIARLEKGESIAFVSDAGTPGVNDPGGKLVALAAARHIPVSPIPGPSALTAAISVCGFPMDEFMYLGFAPHKKGRETFFREIASRQSSTVFFESTHRIAKTLDALARALEPRRLVCVGRELTKLHETVYRGTVADVTAQLKATSTKGEFVIIIAPKKFTDS